LSIKKIGTVLFDFLNEGCYYKNLKLGLPVLPADRQVAARETFMAIDKETVKYAANLARIELQQKELEKLSGQLHSILDFIDKLKKADIKNISPTSHILPLNNVLRDDELRKSLPLEKTLKNSPQREGNFFSVPKIIE
jgi:aspartyl-tRNA(Asn)/glutamyl-tRNA(Gln) amidotransferase subunit C